MQIDSHQHFWRFDPSRDLWITNEMAVLRKDYLPSELHDALARNGIDGCVAVQADQSKTETDFLLDLATKHAFISGVVGWIDVLSPSLVDELDRYAGIKKLKGFRHIVQAEPRGFLSNQKFIEGVKVLGKRGYTYDLLIYPYQLEEALYFIDKAGDVRIVIDHMAKPAIKTGEKTHWEMQMAAVSTFENVYCKVSGLVTEADWTRWKKGDIFPYLDEIMEMFGPSRMMYGSDWPVCLLAASYEQQLEVVTQYISSLSESEKKMIMGDNAIKFYRL